jgi:hypothetical protein
MHLQYFVRTTFLSWRKRWELEANKQLEKITNNEYIYTVQYNVKYLTILPRTLVVFSAKNTVAVLLAKGPFYYTRDGEGPDL